MRRAWIWLVLVLAAAPSVAMAQDANPNATTWGVGVRARAVTVPTWLLDLFVEHSTPMTSFGVGVEAVRRRGNFDMTFGLEYENVSPEDGYWLENGGTLTQADLDYVTFDGLALLGLDATFAWHANITPMFQFRYGAGIGVGLVMGDVLQTDAFCDPGTPLSALDDPQTTQCRTVPGAPAVKSSDVPPAVPIVHAFVGLRIRLTDKININVDGGFRDMFYLGLATDYMF